MMEQMYGITPEIKERFENEDLCRRCGICCRSGTEVKGRMVLLKDLPCRHLSHEPGGKTYCRIYEHRERTGWCYKINLQGLQKKLFPPDCPYVQGLKGYKGKIELTDEQFQEVIPILRNLFPLVDRPEYIKKKDWDYFMGNVLGLKVNKK